MSFSETWATFKLLHLSKPASDRILYKTVRGRTIASVLEINIASLERTERLIGWLRTQGNEGAIRYAAIDMFEMGEGAQQVGLKTFHQKLASLGVKPLPIPGTPQQGLPRIANTLGGVDLIIFSGEASELQSPTLQPLLTRATHQNSIILAHQDGVMSLVAPPQQLVAPLQKAA
ncbi:hypothetical protein FF011L_41680 [Roseimaritima multifibrata]|uniref:Uncharacterized protein n=1 Tax=Roseimaritima multifibrata TaxID=1930274 RepID=A0A517MKF8_9BACT|nr:hypothetical protein [Roseimaritima multifibrata]QDS95372.1 hypothetical protein FF011L_41680 [Roseimaritima multifibrata]